MKTNSSMLCALLMFSSVSTYGGNRSLVSNCGTEVQNRYMQIAEEARQIVHDIDNNRDPETKREIKVGQSGHYMRSFANNVFRAVVMNKHGVSLNERDRERLFRVCRNDFSVLRASVSAYLSRE